MVSFSKFQAAPPMLSQRLRGAASTLVRTAFAFGLGLAIALTIPVTPPALAAGAETMLRQNLPAALRGDRVAVREVARAIVRIGPRSFKAAAQMRPLLRSEALQGSSAAANAYGILLQYGIGGPKNPKEAASWYAKGGASGNLSASKNAALAYALGWGVQRNTKRANQLLAKVPSDQRSRKMLEISKALMHPGREEPELALYWLERAVSLDKNGQLNAAGAYRKLAGSMENGDEKLLEWLQPLAEKGNVRATIFLARHYEESGTEPARVKAADLYFQAAAAADPDAYEGLGRLLTVTQPPLSDRIMTFLEDKAQAGVASANLALGTHYLFGATATGEMREKGMAHLEAAARAGDPETQYRLALILLGDASDSKQHDLARAYLVLSAAGGNKLAAQAAKQFGPLTVADAREIVETARN
ncbi:SEL1-like repeat protein [Rhizobium sp. AG855]|uniref:tetratricopeptide repeat protein n=1 Tax=Rhizobium sp. AG855 TaxID=2183898 RepID=UPI000E71577E|nr:SEL1-like repeat protein [Rhizobium sp. AG855]RKE80252.1 TPR repeat protein [Rhizobium sp. AG855]